MDIKNNPVGRLHEILCEANNHQPGERAQSVWAKVLDAPAGDVGALLKLLAGLIDLKDEAKQALMDGVDGDPSIFLAPFTKIDQIFHRIDLSAQWNNSKQYLDIATLNALAFGDHLLERKQAKLSLTAEQTFDFIEKLDGLLRQCINSNLPAGLKKLFRRNLESLRQALITYKISGAQAVEDEVDRMIGAMSRHSSEITDQTDEESKGFMKSVFELIGNINESIQLAETAAKLSGPAVIAFLPMFQ